MYLPTLLSFALWSLAHGLPQSPVAPSAAQAMIIQVSDFHAWTTEPGSTEDNWAAFLVYDDAYTYGAVCSINTNESLYSADAWYPCELRKNSTAMAVSFQISEGFGQVVMKKGWDSNGYVLRDSLLSGRC